MTGRAREATIGRQVVGRESRRCVGQTFASEALECRQRRSCQVRINASLTRGRVKSSRFILHCGHAVSGKHSRWQSSKLRSDEGVECPRPMYSASPVAAPATFLRYSAMACGSHVDLDRKTSFETKPMSEVPKTRCSGTVQVRGRRHNYRR